ncbi:hypothetical protein BDA96_03G289600 [Sorghum bicolor]|uniref:Uncharacterized protein n=1 Tax=Sorghum bicolor TaxID=4558 RepID=A0A921RHF6_SORBI|nr:hypothetical protein BDA96_03G289600 [Sorghum bicolor]
MSVRGIPVDRRPCPPRRALPRRSTAAVRGPLHRPAAAHDSYKAPPPTFSPVQISTRNIEKRKKVRTTPPKEWRQCNAGARQRRASCKGTRCCS